MHTSLRWLFGFTMILAVGCGETVIDGTGGAGGASTTGASTTGTATGTATGTGGSGCDSPAAKACAGAGDCVLAATNCCVCGTPEITDYAAVNQASVGLCGCDGPACGCPIMLNPNLAASCEAGACVGWDVRKRADYAGCSADSDCRLRFGLACCEPAQGNDFELVAIRNDAVGAIENAVCGPGDTDSCLDCVPSYPASKKAVCVNGYCQVADTGQGGSTGGCK